MWMGVLLVVIVTAQMMKHNYNFSIPIQQESFFSAR
jgi:hypothetical protein